MDYRFTDTTYTYKTINKTTPSYPGNWTSTPYSTPVAEDNHTYTNHQMYLYTRLDGSQYEVEDPFPDLTENYWKNTEINWDPEDKVTWDELAPSLQELIIRKIKWEDLHSTLQHRWTELEKYARETRRKEEWLWANRADATYSGTWNGFPYYKIEQHFNNDPNKVLTTLYFVAGDYASPRNRGQYKNGIITKEFPKFILWPEQYAKILWVGYSRQVLCSVGYVDWDAYIDKINNTGMRMVFDSTMENKADIKARFYVHVVGIMDRSVPADPALPDDLADGPRPEPASVEFPGQQGSSTLSLPGSYHKYENGWDFYGGAGDEKWSQPGPTTSPFKDLADFNGIGGTYVATFTGSVLSVGRGAGVPPENIRGEKGDTTPRYSGVATGKQSAIEIGYDYAAYVGIRMTTALGTRKWILVATGAASSSNFSYSQIFTVTDAEVASPCRVDLYVASRDGHSWSEYGTVVSNVRLTIKGVKVIG